MEKVCKHKILARFSSGLSGLITGCNDSRNFSGNYNLAEKLQKFYPQAERYQAAAP
jgi:hypothetical protein